MGLLAPAPIAIADSKNAHDPGITIMESKQSKPKDCHQSCSDKHTEGVQKCIDSKARPLTKCIEKVNQIKKNCRRKCNS